MRKAKTPPAMTVRPGSRTIVIGRKPTYVPIDRIRVTERKSDVPSAQVMREWKENGELVPLVLIRHREHLYLLDGHHRLNGWKAMGRKRVPAWVVRPYDRLVSANGRVPDIFQVSKVCQVISFYQLRGDDTHWLVSEDRLACILPHLQELTGIT